MVTDRASSGEMVRMTSVDEMGDVTYSGEGQDDIFGLMD